MWSLQLQVLRELAQHAAHADILREQVLGRRPTMDRSCRALEPVQRDPDNRGARLLI